MVGGRLRLLGVAVTVLSGGAGLLGGVPPAAAGPPPGSATIAGYVYGLDGRTVGAGRTVELVAWPRNEDLTRARVGQRVPTRVLARSATDATGRFALGLAGSGPLRRLAAADGTLNLSLESAADGLPYSYSLSRRLGTASAARTGAAATAAGDGTEIDLRPLRGAPLPAARADAAPAHEPTFAAAPCGVVKLATLGPRWVEVGRAFTATGTSAAMTYRSGSSSTLGVGVSVDKGATFSESGSTSVGSTSTVGMTTLKGSGTRAWRTTFAYTKYGYTCTGLGHYTKIWVKATSFAGGSSYTTSPAPAASYCVTQVKGSSFTKDQSTSSTFQVGAGTAGDIEITLSAQTGYSTAASVRFTFSATRRLCGTNGYPGGDPGQLRATI